MTHPEYPNRLTHPGGGEADLNDETLIVVREIKNGGGTRCGHSGII